MTTPYIQLTIPVPSVTYPGSRTNLREGPTGILAAIRAGATVIL